jgi:ABC-type multidrug transport system ATPase subunit
LLLDEPAAGLNPVEKQSLRELVQLLRQQFQLTVLIIEHHVPLIMQLCDRLAVLNFGKRNALGNPEQVRNEPLVIEAYLGKGNPWAPRANENRIRGRFCEASKAKTKGITQQPHNKKRQYNANNAQIACFKAACLLNY